MGMFLNYHNIADNYQPNNLINAFPHGCTNSKLNPLDASKPYEEYDAKGDLIGYFWHYGETLNLEFNIDGELTLESDAIIFKSVGQEPDNTTLANVGQRAYNVIDMRSWTCAYVTRKGDCVWEEDEEFTYPEDGNNLVYVSAADYLRDKHATITLYNFRHEQIHKSTVSASPTIIFTIDTELSKKLTKGIYYCSLVVFDDTMQTTIFDANDCNLLVK